MSLDDSYLLDIVVAAREVRQLRMRTDQRTFQENRFHQLAFMKLLQDIGKAASRLSPAARTAFPDVPWREIIGLRHHLVHDYAGIDLNRIWLTIQQDVEPLLEALEPAIRPDDS
jgi:uncharacterized protein with HEPN domain